MITIMHLRTTTDSFPFIRDDQDLTILYVRFLELGLAYSRFVTHVVGRHGTQVLPCL